MSFKRRDVLVQDYGIPSRTRLYQTSLRHFQLHCSHGPLPFQLFLLGKALLNTGTDCATSASIVLPAASPARDQSLPMFPKCLARLVPRLVIIWDPIRSSGDKCRTRSRLSPFRQCSSTFNQNWCLRDTSIHQRPIGKTLHHFSRFYVV